MNHGSADRPRTLREVLDTSIGRSRTARCAVIAVLCGYFLLVAWRIWAMSQVLTTFGIDVAAVLPIAPATAALINNGLVVLLLFSPAAVAAYIFLNRDVRYWRTVAAVALAAAVSASWWATHEPGVGTHCYVITPDRGLVVSHIEKDGECGVDRSGLRMRPITTTILICIDAMRRGITPTKVAIDAIDASKMFNAGNAQSLYWFHHADGRLEFYDGPGFDQATLAPLTPVTLQNVAEIRSYIKTRQAAERTARERAAARTRAAAAREKRERDRRARAVAIRLAREAQEREEAESQRRAAEARDEEARLARMQLERDMLEAERRGRELRAEEERLAELQRKREEAAARREERQRLAEERRQERVESARQAAAQRGAQRTMTTGTRVRTGTRASGCGEGGCNSTYSTKKRPN